MFKLTITYLNQIIEIAFNFKINLLLEKGKSLMRGQ